MAIILQIFKGFIINLTKLIIIAILTGVAISVTVVTLFLTAEKETGLIVNDTAPAFFTYDVLIFFALAFFVMIVSLPIIIRRYLKKK